ncbi:unnamed protein product [Symbiodinium sp. KB8]|nr:unnamed protein product [Symbiodinium sp. KB8]
MKPVPDGALSKFMTGIEGRPAPQVPGTWQSLVEAFACRLFGAWADLAKRAAADRALQKAEAYTVEIAATMRAAELRMRRAKRGMQALVGSTLTWLILQRVLLKWNFLVASEGAHWRSLPVPQCQDSQFSSRWRCSRRPQAAH